jgi:hypothetical protein
VPLPANYSDIWSTDRQAQNVADSAVVWAAADPDEIRLGLAHGRAGTSCDG